MPQEQKQIALQPIVNYPHEMQIGKTYLMTIDLKTPDLQEDWPYEEEEYPVYCFVDSSPSLTHEALGTPAVIIHRFGGTYGPAKFLLRTKNKENEGQIRISLENKYGAALQLLKLDHIRLTIEGTEEQSKEIVIGLEAKGHQERESIETFLIDYPYRGLSPFREEDEAWFFGREAYTAKLFEMVQQQPFIAVIGPSGNGKSSIVYAGLIPILRRQENWLITSFRPGQHPLRSLSKALIPFLYSGDLEQISKTIELSQLFHNEEIILTDVIERILKKDDKALRFLLFIDQFEELYTLCTDEEERHRFLDQILGMQLPFCHLVIALRADFLGKTLVYRLFADALKGSSIVLGPMNREELRCVIAEPAKKAGQCLSEDIVDLLIEESEDHEGALPLLQFALMQIWEGMANGIQPIHTLKQIGGVGGALANEAQYLFDRLSKTEQKIARRAFLEMIGLHEGVEDTRRRILINDLVTPGENLENIHQVLNHFTQARLITLSSDYEGKITAEITHEALIKHWATLKYWIDQNREDLLFFRRLSEAAHLWDAHNRPEGLLWRPPYLDFLRENYQRNPHYMTELEFEFFKQSDYEDRRVITRITKFLKRYMPSRRGR